MSEAGESGEMKGRVAFVSGASRGIGAGLAERFAERGLRLVLCSRSAPVLPDGDDVLARQVDVRDEAALEALVVEAEARFGAIDLWVNNAGVLDPIDKLRDVEAEAFRHHVDVNLTGVFLGTRCYVRHLHRAARPGVLINVSSGASTSAYQGWSVYCATKAAVDHLTRVVALEEEAIGLRAHSVAPGVVDTGMQALIRASSEDRFPDVPRFLEMKEAEAFNSPRFVADEFLALAFDPARRTDEVAVRLESESG
ncbi:MAG: SDR family oxidoreductase [Myxococcota bacterium]